ncbi:hypothetical protein HSBAA_33880 [Vreelandella sulfidaeris]|uniref:RNA polymerase sigma-70 region 2 domain-containing protein n=1 Tax=Vreelandella sulfidaeris TaxID=115553 RepID=A0A455U7I2_9GAMM|nr:hypothetical protein HSBAA_33880 [Halomonas sulfidaeris]
MMTATHSTEEHIATLRPKLVAFARLQLRDNTAAEDAVQDTLVTALEKHQTFRGVQRLKRGCLVF